MTLLALVAALVSIFNYFSTSNGIHGTPGALLVVGSTILMLLAAAVLTMGWGPRWLRLVLEILIVLDFLGTGLAAWFLEAWILLALDGLAFLAWLLHFTPAARRARPELV